MQCYGEESPITICCLFKFIYINITAVVVAVVCGLKTDRILRHFMLPGVNGILEWD